ncbi:MAG: efflux RND transporter periplasmic adaptor subunit [Pseudomonadota bacterium]
MPNKIVLLLTIFALLSGAGFAAEDGQSGETEEWYRVEPSGSTVVISLGGTVIPYKEVTLAAQLPGRVRSIAGIEGDHFKTNDVLVTLDDSTLVAQRNAALAQMGSAQSALQNARVQYNRELWSPRSKQAMGGMGMPNLFDSMFSRPLEEMADRRDTDAERYSDLFSQTTAIQQAQNTIYQVQAQLHELDTKFRDAKSLAPFDGVITKKYVEVGDTMQPGQPLLVYADVEYLQVVVDVPSRIAPGLREGDMLQAELEVGNKVVPVRVSQIFPMADVVRHTVKVKFDLPQGVSRPGAYVKVKVPDVTAGQSGLVKIPLTAVRFNGSLPGVFVKGADGLGHLRLVRIGEHLDDTYVSILSGLQVGDEVLRQAKVR